MAARAALAAALAGAIAAAQGPNPNPLPDCTLEEEDRVNLRNGYCDAIAQKPYNTEQCGWDGGDCCQETCRSTEKLLCGFTNNNTVRVGFPQCKDPRVCLATDPRRLGDGLCDNAYNSLNCNWDGGDCCSQTCEDSAEHECGFNPNNVEIGFPNCLDHLICNVRDPAIIGDGHCHAGNVTGANVPACGWDGGDCCVETCESTANFTCGFNGDQQIGYPACRDPNACLVPGFFDNAGNGLCNAALNTNACNWDGGDWCVLVRGPCLRCAAAARASALRWGQHASIHRLSFETRAHALLFCVHACVCVATTLTTTTSAARRRATAAPTSAGATQTAPLWASPSAPTQSTTSAARCWTTNS